MGHTQGPWEETRAGKRAVRTLSRWGRQEGVKSQGGMLTRLLSGLK